ncbi:inorganic phosphate transporter [Afifella sp. IM 167]|uniref:inorganic phosphate transporter n=1 Tax=Afifella sp. IM 167 TaxID=2033586 RepID=UPI001CCA79F1|nr:inorganic phosphate transporter [Afifella sp. IM 167]MBZ8134689.1 phosphate permease [Afifella sp. IM 167]
MTAEAEASGPAPQTSPEASDGLSWLSIVFGALLLAVTAYFLFWAQGYTEGHRNVALVLATVFGVFMAFNIGGNDVANSFGTSVGAGTLTIRQALAIAAIFEVSGAVIAGGAVTDTIRGGIVDLGQIDIAPADFVYIMMSALIAAALWLLFATSRGYPVSTTHSIVGAIVGSSIALGILMDSTDTAYSLVQWRKVGEIVISWVLSPLLGGAVAYLLFWQIKKRILTYNDAAAAELDRIREAKVRHNKAHKAAFERLSEIQQISYTHAMTRDMQILNDSDFRPEDLETDYYRGLQRIESERESIRPHRALEKLVPPIAAAAAVVIAGVLLLKGLGHMELGLSLVQDILIVTMAGGAVWMAVFVFAKLLKSQPLGRATFLLFSWMQVFTAAGFAFSHGSNDIANAIGPFAAILDVLRTGNVGQDAPVPALAMITFGVALVAGLWFIGKHVIRTVGHNLTRMHPASGFSAELSASAVVLLASILGLPVSSTHILIGAVLGIGLVNRSTNWKLMRPIAFAWIVTLPAAAALSAAAFLALRVML